MVVDMAFLPCRRLVLRALLAVVAGIVDDSPIRGFVQVFWFFWFWFFGFGLVPFLDLLLVYLRRPCAGRHLLFFVLPKKSRQKKGAENASFLNVSLTGNGNP
jgi:hypothetical protein